MMQLLMQLMKNNWSTNPDSKVHGANMGPTWVLSALDGPHVGPLNLAIRECEDIFSLVYGTKVVDKAQTQYG